MCFSNRTKPTRSSDVGQSRPDDGSRRPGGAKNIMVFFEGDEMGILRGVII